MIPEYIQQDVSLQQVPTKEELVENYNDKTRVKRILLYIAYYLERSIRYGKDKYVLISFWQLKNFKLKDEDKPIIEEFFTEKGYTVLIDEVKLRITILIDPDAQIEEDIVHEDDTEDDNNDGNGYVDEVDDGDSEILDEDDPWRFR